MNYSLYSLSFIYVQILISMPDNKHTVSPSLGSTTPRDIQLRIKNFHGSPSSSNQKLS